MGQVVYQPEALGGLISNSILLYVCQKEEEEGKVSRHALKYQKQSNGLKMVEKLKWQIGLQGDFEEISAVTRDIRLDQDRGSGK